MAIKGMSTCAHCKALISTPICPICGKSIHDEVEIEDLGPIKRTMATEDRRRVIGFATFVVLAVVLSAGVYVVVNRETAEPVPTLLAAPTETTSTIRTEGDAPTVTRPDGPVEPLPTFETGAERDVGGGTSPWAGALPLNILDGDLLPDADLDPGIEAVAAIVASAPPGWQFGPSTTAEVNGVALDVAELDQQRPAGDVGRRAREALDQRLDARARLVPAPERAQGLDMRHGHVDEGLGLDLRVGLHLVEQGPR